MKILWLFTHPQVIPNLYEFHSLTKQKTILWKSMPASNCMVTNILQNIFFQIFKSLLSDIQKTFRFLVGIFFFNHGNSLPFVFLQVFWIIIKKKCCWYKYSVPYRSFTHKGSHNCLTIGIYYTCELSFFSVKSHG